MPAEAIVTLRSASAYSQSKAYDAPKKPKETAKDYEERTWQERMHVHDGQVYIPPMGFKNCLSEAAKFLSEQIPGKGKSTYTKHFEAGVLCLTPGMLENFKGEPIEASKVQGEWVFVPSDGVRGSGKRVWKCFPMIYEWQTTIQFKIHDDTVTQSVFDRTMQQAGVLIGLGRWRVRNNGLYGMFTVESINWKEFTF